MNKFIQKLKMCWVLLTKRHRHHLLIQVTTEDMIKFFENKEEFEADLYYQGFTPYVINAFLQRYSNSLDPVDMILAKAEFEAKAELNTKNKQKIIRDDKRKNGESK